MGIAQRSIDDLRLRLDIVAVVEPYVQLKKTGRTYKGLSPFTNEKTPSFTVNPDKNVYYCFSSAQGGDAIDFIRKLENLSFPEAVELLARRFQIDLEYDGRAASQQERSLRGELLEMHEQAAWWFRQGFLHEHSQATEVRAYWTERRQFPLELAEEFTIGFAPPNASGLVKFLANKGFHLEGFAQCGLFYANERARSPEDFRPRFRGRLMIPIRNTQGQIVAFTARQLDCTPQDDPAREAKYVNSPETPLFSKGRLLFNLHEARRHVDAEKRFLMVEGQLDALRCWQHGFRATLAPQGTAVTPEQLDMLRRYHQPLHVILDGDRAGRAAALKVLPMALAAGLEVRFLALPAGADPDDLLREEGPAALQSITPIGPVAFLIEVAGISLEAPPTDRALAAERLLPALASAPSGLYRAACADELGERLRLPSSPLREALERLARHTAQNQARRNASEQARHKNPMSSPVEPSREDPASPGDHALTPPNESRNNPSSRLTTVEGELLSLIFQEAWLAEQIAQTIDQDWVDTSTVEGRLLAHVLAEILEQLWDGPDHWREMELTESARSMVCSILAAERTTHNPAEAARLALLHLHRKAASRLLSQARESLLRSRSPDERRLASAQVQSAGHALANPPEFRFEPPVNP